MEDSQHVLLISSFIPTNATVAQGINKVVGFGFGLSIVSAIMRAITSLLLLGAAGLRSAFGLPGFFVKRADVESFIATQEPLSLERLLCNIGDEGCEARDAPPGVVVASPSRRDPDYWYTWTRDAGLVLKAVAERFSVSFNGSLQETLQEFVVSQAILQGVSNPSGPFIDGSGLGEPKFNVDLTQFTGAWGRPQRDGPALRAIAILGYAKWLVANGYPQTVAEIAWPVIRNDLAYVAQYWNDTGFDLWEEVSGSSFFTVASQYRALIEGSALAADIGASCSACDSIAPQVLCFLQSFWSPSRGAMIANINQNNGRGGLDANTLLASIHSFDPSLGCDSLTFQPCSDKALSNHKAVTDSFRPWPINNGIPRGQAVAVGRYIEDVYFNGNPWYLTTLAAAEQLYDALQVWESQGWLEVTDTSLSFFRDLDSAVSPGTYASTTATYRNLVSRVMDYADGYVAKVAQYTPADGRLAEQYDKATGAPLSARDLTWSYAAFLTAAAARTKVQSGTFGWWSGAGAPSLPDTCSATAVAGAYISATATTWPTAVVPDGGSETVTTTIAEPSPTTCFVSVTFDVRVTTIFGETIKVVGSVPELGNWNPDNGIPLGAGAYTQDNPLWSVTFSMTPGQTFEYKFVNVAADGTVRWERDPNRRDTLPSGCGDRVTLGGSWQF